MNTLYAACVARNIPVQNHESDLYIPVTEETTKLVKEFGLTPTTFVNQVEGGQWYDVPFAYMPWWEKRIPNAEVAQHCSGVAGTLYGTKEVPANADYCSLAECVASGQHLQSCDDDGYCNFCGEQEAQPDGWVFVDENDEEIGFAEPHDFANADHAVQKFGNEYGDGDFGVCFRKNGVLHSCDPESTPQDYQ